MKKVMMTLALVASMFVYSQAQQGGGGRGGRGGNPEERAKRTADNLEKELKLTAVQKDSVYSFTLAQSKEQQSLFQQGGGGDREAAMAKFKTLQDKTDAKIKALLTDDQKTKYEAYVKQRAERMRNFGGGRRGGNGGGNNN